MIALSVPADEVKVLMRRLLKEELFDFFELREAGVRSFAAFEIRGIPTEPDGDGAAGYTLWRTVRPYVFGIVKGAARPRGMKFVFSMPADRAAALTPLAAVLFLNITFENGGVLITTGLTQKSFSLDKEADGVWDAYVRRFFKEGGIAAEVV